MTLRTTTAAPAQACIALASLFQDPLLEEPGLATTAALRHQQNLLQGKAERACMACPLMSRCLYQAVVEHDINGYVAGTTARQRQQIRNLLGTSVEPEDLDSFCGASAAKRQIDPHEVLRMRAANPNDSLEAIAQRLGCSLSTVKRHLRRARNHTLPAERSHSSPRPTLREVLDAARMVCRGRRVLRNAA